MKDKLPGSHRRLVTRRRLLMFACLTALLTVALAGWFYWAYVKLTEDERKFVGTWASTVYEAESETSITGIGTFHPNHKATLQIEWGDGRKEGMIRYRWYVRGGIVTMDWSGSRTWGDFLEQFVRELRFGESPIKGAYKEPRIISYTEDEVVLEDYDGSRLVWKRLPEPAVTPAEPEVVP